MKDIPRLTDLEIKIMKVLWEKERNLTAQEIAGYLEREKISTASVTQSIKHLIKKKAVMVSNHVLVASVYAREFSPCFSKEEFLVKEIERLQKSVMGKKKVDSFGFAAALLSNEKEENVKVDEVEKLQKHIDYTIERLKNGE